MEWFDCVNNPMSNGKRYFSFFHLVDQDLPMTDWGVPDIDLLSLPATDSMSIGTARDIGWKDTLTHILVVRSQVTYVSHPTGLCVVQFNHRYTTRAKLIGSLYELT